MTTSDSRNDSLETATLGGGCFWCLEAVYERLEGVERVRSGYSGGETENPTYREVCSGRTGHAEVVQVEFDPSVTRYREILDVFFTIHDPTTRDRQGPDIGSQYRSVIFYHSPEQKETAEATIRALEAEGVWDDPIITEIEPYQVFYEAENYHQEYYRNHPTQPYCQAIIDPKVAKLRERFRDKLKAPA